ncbi:hypothetical protein [Bradyrhizobium sp. CCBAU 65884]|uniref:hypothetical protein n=1 Tax=Bradyrhizobium sp. CCBAU 65884 TaxID=722477 RepID=UPI00230540CE|nr:hypothetical protein [Bradyrhizobium sp. CCBAU 65884]
MDKGNIKSASDFEALRLLRAFAKIGDAKRRQEVIDLAEKLAAPPITEIALRPDEPPTEADQ